MKSPSELPPKSWRTHSKEHLRLAWPLCLGQAGQQLMALVDSSMVGHYDRITLAGFGIANTLLLALTFFGVGILLSLDSLIPQAIGKGRPKLARSYYHSGIQLALRISIPLTLLGLIAPILLVPLGVHPDISQEARIYLYGRLPSLLPFLFFTAACSYLQAVGRTRPIVIAVVVGNIINFMADGLLVFGDRALDYLDLPAIGLPALGGLGASISTCIVVIVMALWVGAALRTHALDGDCPGNKKGRQQILKIGLPVGLQLLAEVGVFAIVGILSGILGVLASASHQLALALASLPFSLAVGMSAASAVRVGHAVGRQSHQEARRAGLVGLFWGASFMSIVGFFFIFNPAPLIRLFTNDLEIIEACIPLLIITAIFQLSDATQAILAGALRGAGDTQIPLIANLVGHYGIGLWVGLYLGFSQHLGTAGLWWGLAAGLTATAIILAKRFWTITGQPIQPL